MGLMPGLLIQRRSPCGTEAAAGDLVCLSVGAFSVRRAHTQYFFWPFWVEVLLLHVCYPGSMTAPIVEYNSGVLVKEFQVTRGCDVDCVRRSPSVRTRPFAPSRYTKMKTAATSYFPSRLLRDSAVRHHPPVCMPLPALLAAYSCRASTTGPIPPTAPRSTAHPVQPSPQATCSSSKHRLGQSLSMIVLPQAARSTQAISLIIRHQNVHDRYWRFDPISKLISLRPLRKLLVSSREHAMARGGRGGDAPHRTPATCVRSSHMSSS